MQPTALNDQQTQVFALSTLVQLIKRARHAASMQELAFLIANETHSLVSYRHAVVCGLVDAAGLQIAAISGVSMVERQSPFTQWLGQALPKVIESSPALYAEAKPCAVSARDVAGPLGDEWSEWLPAYGAAVPLVARSGQKLGLVFLAREQPWDDRDLTLLRELADGYAFAWAQWVDANKRRLLVRAAMRRPLTKIAVAAAVLIGLCLPVPLTALAPAEVVAYRPSVVRAPLDGVVDHILVQPNEPVRAGQIVLELDRRAIENRLEIAKQAQAVAEAEYRQAAQQALFDEKSRAQLSILSGRVEQRSVEASYNQSLLDRVEVVAPNDGIAVFDDANDWIGKPVTIGERILEIADPAQVEVEVWLPVADAISLAKGTQVEFFLNIAPQSPLSATLRQTSYEAAMSPSGVLGYRLKAALTAAGKALPRIGLRGTAKIYGDSVSLFYFLMRRPLAAARQVLGL